MSNYSIPVVNACGPCLSEKQIKAKNKKDAEELKKVVNYLTEKYGYRDRCFEESIGRLIVELRRLEGPLK